MNEFSIDAKMLNNEIVLLKVTGFLDAHTFEKMDDQVNTLFDRGYSKIVVDLAQVEYISSAGAGVFIGALSRARENNGNIILVNPTQGVKEVFDLLGLSAIFTIVGNVEMAVSAF